MSAKTLLSDLQARYYRFVVTQGEKLVRSLQQSISEQSLVGDRPFFAPEILPWIADLEAQWPRVRAELDAVLQATDPIPNFQDISVDQRAITADDRWKTYFLYGYGYKAHRNCDRCPETTRLIEAIPGMKTAFFSILYPHKRIPEHCGPYKGLLRYHLGLKVPQDADRCGIRVGGEVRHWQEGKSLLFDDTYPHAAWNDTDELRVVLFVDIVRPLRLPYGLFNRLFINLIALSPYVRDGRRRLLAWEDNRTRSAAP